MSLVIAKWRCQKKSCAGPAFEFGESRAIWPLRRRADWFSIHRHENAFGRTDHKYLAQQVSVQGAIGLRTVGNALSLARRHA